MEWLLLTWTNVVDQFISYKLARQIPVNQRPVNINKDGNVPASKVRRQHIYNPLPSASALIQVCHISFIRRREGGASRDEILQPRIERGEGWIEERIFNILAHHNKQNMYMNTRYTEYMVFGMVFALKKHSLWYG